MFRLTVVTPGGSGSHVWDRDEILIGRGEGSNLRLVEPASSRNHCVLRLERGRALLVDLGSVNGTRVEGRKVQEARLRAGDEFSIGKTVIRVEAYTGSGLALEKEPRVAAAAPVPTGLQPDFSREIRGMIQKAPWYMISLVVHIMALLLLDLVAFRVTAPSHSRMLEAVVSQDAPAPAEKSEPYVPVLDDWDPEVLQAAEDFSEQESNSRSQAKAEEFPEPEFDPDRRKIGTGTSLASRIRPLSIAPVLKDGGKDVDRSNIQGEHEKAKRAASRGLGADLRRLAGLPKDAVVVVGGDFDRMELILDLYDIPHTMADNANIFLARHYPRMKMLCINCMRPPSSAKKGKKLANLVRRFVSGGGWVITSDWAVDPGLTKAFPQYVRLASGKTNRDTTVDVSPSRLTSPLLDGVFSRRVQTKWWLEEASKFVNVETHRVNVLVTSDDMKARFGSDVVVFEFRSGSGRVLHLLGHFYQKDGTLTGLAAMQRLILNFLTDRFLKE